MKPTISILFLLACIASGQTLEATIMLPDTLGPLNGPPYHLAWDDNPDHPRLYIGGEADSGGVIVAEAITCKRLARIPTGPVKSLYFVPLHRKLYVASLSSNTVEVVDGATNQIVSTITVPGVVPVMQYNSVNDRLYCGGDSIAVIDCTSDTVMNTIPVSATVFALDSGRDRLYAGSSGPLSVIDCERDSVVAAILGVDSAGALCFNPTATKVYAVSGDTLFIVGTQADSVVGRIALSELAPLLACDPQRNRVYFADGNRFGSLDCESDTVLMVHSVGEIVTFLACDVSRDRLYLTPASYYPDAMIFNASTGQYVTQVAIDGVSSGGGWSASLDRLYCLPRSTNRLLTAIDCAAGGVAGIVPLMAPGGSLSVDSVDNKIYLLYAGTTIGCIAAVDCLRNVVTSYTYAGTNPGVMCYNAVNDRLYWSVDAWNGAGGSVIAYDCLADTVVTRIPVGGGVRAFQLHSRFNRLYAQGYDTLGYAAVYIIDCSEDSVVGRIALPDRHVRETHLVLEDDRLWCLGTDRVVAIDCLGDSVVADTATGLGSIDDAVFCPEDQKIVAGWEGRPLWIVDMDNPAHVETLPRIHPNGGMRFSYFPNAHKVYWCANYNGYPANALFSVIDGRTNVITADFWVPGNVSGLCLDHTGDYVYCSRYTDLPLVVIDSRSDSVVATVELLPGGADEPVLNTRSNRLYLVQAGAISVVHDSMTIGLEESRPAPTMLRTEATMLRRGVPFRTAAAGVLLDISGRKVADLHPGANDVRALAPGVYFIREGRGAGDVGQGQVRKVVITR